MAYFRRMIRNILLTGTALLLAQAGSAQANEPLFTLLSPPQTHVDFVNTVVDTKAHNVLIYSNYYGRAGVGVGDFNRDGFQDLFFAGNLTADRLYLNRGGQGAPLEFTDVTEAAGISDNGGWSSGVVVADVNNDGCADIYVAHDFDAPDCFFLNNQDGTFTNVIDSAMHHISYYSMGVDAADIDNDDWLDLMVLDMVAEDNFRLKANMSGMNPQSLSVGADARARRGRKVRRRGCCFSGR